MTPTRPPRRHKVAVIKARGPGGRPSDYEPAYGEQARKLCLLGATDADLADFFGVDERTINRWKEAHPEFCRSLKEAKAQADAEVEDRLFRRATGYSHEAVKIFMPAGATEPVYAPYVQHHPPDTTACIFWLKNRQPARWRDKTEIEHGGEVDTRAYDRIATVKQILADIFAPPVKPDAAPIGDPDGNPKLVH